MDTRSSLIKHLIRIFSLDQDVTNGDEDVPMYEPN